MAPKSNDPNNYIEVTVELTRQVQEFEPYRFKVTERQVIDPGLPEEEKANIRQSLIDGLTPGLGLQADLIVQEALAYNATTGRSAAPAQPRPAAPAAPANRPQPTNRPAKPAAPAGGSRTGKRAKASDIEDLGFLLEKPNPKEYFGVRYQVAAEAFSCKGDLYLFWMETPEKKWIEVSSLHRNNPSFAKIEETINGDPNAVNIWWQDDEDKVYFQDGMSRLFTVEHSIEANNSGYAWVNIKKTEIVTSESLPF